jgi:hypothetical protein
MVALIAKVGSLADRVCIKLLRRCEAQRPARPHAMRRVPGRHFSLELLLSTGQPNARILIGESLQPLTVFRHLTLALWTSRMDQASPKRWKIQASQVSEQAILGFVQLASVLLLFRRF